jgi:hypothetical protein
MGEPEALTIILPPNENVPEAQTTIAQRFNAVENVGDAYRFVASVPKGRLNGMPCLTAVIKGQE